MLFENYFEGRVEHLLNINGASLEFFYYKPSVAERIKLKLLHILCLLNILICLVFILVLWREEPYLWLGIVNLMVNFLGTPEIRCFYLATGFKYLKIPLAIAWLTTLSLTSYLVYVIVLMVLKIVEVHF